MRISLFSLFILFSVTSQAKEAETALTDFKLDTDAAVATVKSDYKAFYASDRLWRAAKVYAVGAVMANTNIDTEFHSWHQDTIHSDTSDDVAKVAKLFGEKIIMAPLAVAAASWQLKEPESPIGRWGEKTFRSYLVGGPAMFAVQLMTGGSRPKDEYQNAHWRPFNDDNGVSGHSFVGAVPFLTLARMPELSRTQKYLAYAASTLSAWSRINDDAHYLSQAMLGWYMAWESVDAVYDSGEIGSWYSVQPYAFGDGFGLALVASW